MPTLVLQFQPTNLDPEPVLGGAANDYSSGEIVNISAPSTATNSQDEDLIFDEWTIGGIGDVGQPDAGDLLPDNFPDPLDLSEPNLQFVYPNNVILFTMVAHYEVGEEEDESEEGSEHQVDYQRDVTNIGELTPDQQNIIIQRFGTIQIITGADINIIVPDFPQLPMWTINNSSYFEGNPVDVDYTLTSGYQFEAWYQDEEEALLGIDDDFEPPNYLYNTQSGPLHFDMPDGDLTLQLETRAVGPFTLTTSKNMDGGEVTEGGEFPLASLEPFQAGVAEIEATVNYGYEFIGWTGDIEFIADGYAVNDTNIEVNVMTNISLEAIYQYTEEEEVFVVEQSVGPYTSRIEPVHGHHPELLKIFQPKQGRNLTVTDSRWQVSEDDEGLITLYMSASIWSNSDNRFPLGTYTLNNRDFWENITFNPITRDSQIDPGNFSHDTTRSDPVIKIAAGNLLATADGFVVKPPHGSNFSVETLPFVRNIHTNRPIPLNEYYDKEIESGSYDLATEGKVNLKFGLRMDGRTTDGNINLYYSRTEKNQSLKDAIILREEVNDEGITIVRPNNGYYLTSLDWGDGSEKEYTSNPQLLEESIILEHVYDNPGFYTIKGVVFFFSGYYQKVAHWEKFESNMVLNPSKNYDNGMFSINNFAMVGGISVNSSFAKTFYNLAGYNPLTKEPRESAVLDNFNEMDKIHMLDTLSKFDSQNVSDEYNELIEAYSSEITGSSGNIIHNGFIDKRLFDSFQSSSLSNADIATTKMYKGVKSMWEHLGFTSDDSDIPNSNIYWNNIVSKEYTFENINGITVQDSYNPMDGSRVPRTPYKEIIIREDVSQNWEGGYHWPLLPNINKFGVFAYDTGSHGHLVNQPDKKFFGSKSSWDGDDNRAPITNMEEQSEDLILNIDFDQTITDDLIDSIGIFDVQYNNDYEVGLSKNLRIKKLSESLPDPIEKSKVRQAY